MRGFLYLLATGHYLPHSAFSFNTPLPASRGTLYTNHMLHVSRSLPDIAVLRGGNEEFGKSLAEGGEVLSSLKKLGYKPLDVLIDKDGHWTLQGVPSDAHEVFTRCHTIVDTTRMRSAPHHALAKKMGVTMLFSRGNAVNMDREDMYRLLRMQGVKVPDTITVRAKAPLRDSLFRDIWSTHHTPLLVRPTVKQEGNESKLITMYGELENTLREYHGKGTDVHILTYKRVPTTSLTVLPNFRGEKLYMPLWVETFANTNEIPSPRSVAKVYKNAPEWRKEQLRTIVEKVYDAAGLKGPVIIDVIWHNDDYVVVNIEERPSLVKGSRFMQSLESTGANLGEYVHSQIQNSYFPNA